jgi:hypothetical protein
MLCVIIRLDGSSQQAGIIKSLLDRRPANELLPWQTSVEPPRSRSPSPWPSHRRHRPGRKSAASRCEANATLLRRREATTPQHLRASEKPQHVAANSSRPRPRREHPARKFAARIGCFFVPSSEGESQTLTESCVIPTSLSTWQRRLLHRGHTNSCL